MEDILREILHELKTIRQELEKRPVVGHAVIKIDDDVVVDGIIKKINAETRISKHGLISV